MSFAFDLGVSQVEPPCIITAPTDFATWGKALPAGFRDEFPEMDFASSPLAKNTADDPMGAASNRVTHVWMTLGQVLDPSLISTNGTVSNRLGYWAFRNFAQENVNLPLMYAHRIATQTAYWAKMRGTPLFPKVPGPFNNAGTDWLHPLLATENQQSAGLDSAVALDHKKLPSAAVN